jgi:hypothetical protein
MYYNNSTEFYISLALFALLFIGSYLIDHHHEKLGVKVITPIILLAFVTVVLGSLVFIYYLFRAIFM